MAPPFRTAQRLAVVGRGYSAAEAVQSSTTAVLRSTWTPSRAEIQKLVAPSTLGTLRCAWPLPRQFCRCARTHPSVNISHQLVYPMPMQRGPKGSGQDPWYCSRQGELAARLDIGRLRTDAFGPCADLRYNRITTTE